MPKNKPGIAIDLDEVLVETAQKVLDSYNRLYKTSVPLKNYYSQNPKIWKAPNMVIVGERLNKYLESKEYMSSKPVKDTLATIRNLKKKYRLYVLTGRPETMEMVTKTWINHHFSDTFEDVVLTSWLYKNERSKGEVCVDLDVDYLIDDHLSHIVDASKFGVNGLLFGNYPWNKTDILPENVRRVSGWKEVAKTLL